VLKGEIADRDPPGTSEEFMTRAVAFEPVVVTKSSALMTLFPS
jgi:hypothetical protein